MAECNDSVDSANQSIKRNLSTSMKEALDTIVKKIVRDMQSALLRLEYLDFLQDDPTRLKNLIDDVLCQLKEHLTFELQKIFKGENMEALLGSLSEIIDQNAENLGKTSWRPSGNPHEDTLDYLYAPKLKQKEELDGMLVELENENEVLMGTVQKNYEEILQKDVTIEQLTCDFKKAMEIFNINSVEATEMDQHSRYDNMES